MPSFEFAEFLQTEMAAIDAAGLRRQLRRIESAPGVRLRTSQGELLNFSSNDYLGLSQHPALKEAARQAIGRFGTGSTASRLVCGSIAPHHELEEKLAEFKGTEAALAFSSGYSAALGVIPALAGRNDTIVLDKLSHSSLVQAARLSGAKLRVFHHNDLDDLEKILKWADSRSAPGAGAPRPRVWVVTESVFSMDGDRAPLRALAALKEKYGAWLLVDEAHAIGVIGRGGRGLADAENVADRIEVQLGTLSKALGSAGGYVSGSNHLIQLLVNRARSFIFSTAPPPAAAAAASAALDVVRSKEGDDLRAKLWAAARRLSAECPPCRGDSVGGAAPASAIFPIRIGGEKETAVAASRLLERGVLVPAIRYPSVARGQARLRVTVSAAHSEPDLDQLIAALKSLDW